MAIVVVTALQFYLSYYLCGKLIPGIRSYTYIWHYNALILQFYIIQRIHALYKYYVLTQFLVLKPGEILFYRPFDIASSFSSGFQHTVAFSYNLNGVIYVSEHICQSDISKFYASTEVDHAEPGPN